MNKITKEEIKSKLDELEVVKGKLKENFIGIDNSIDQFIDSVKIWYAAPEFQLRPLIVNLWGMTGVGKTDLIRNFVKLISFNDRFIELQMDNLKNDHYFGSGIQTEIESVLENGETSGILLLDEMQRFKTIDESGKDLPKDQLDKYSDIWSLLSDGKFTNDSSKKESLISLMYSLIDEIEGQKEAKKIAEKEKKKEGNKEVKKYKTYYWRAKRIKKVLKLEDNIEDIMKLDTNEILNLVSKAIDDPTIYEGDFYSKLLIIISGNLDEAYRMSEETDNSDVDADILHEHSKRITFIDIKSALANRFKPEQIARFGNNHIIYPSLSRNTYHKIIRLKCDDIIKNVKNKCGVNISLGDEVFDVIYRNGVFPTQGVRPVLSTISSILENSIPFFIYNCMQNEVNNILISFKDGSLFTNISGSDIKYKITTVIDDIKTSKTDNIESLVAAHEVGHSVAYITLMKVVPKQLVCSTASSTLGGFIMTHESFDSKEILKNKIIISLAGQAAEEILFGESKKTFGAKADIQAATANASNYVRCFGMDGFIGNIVCDANPVSLSYGIIDKNKSNESINTLLSECKTEALNIINKNLPLLKKLTLTLLEKKVMRRNDIFDIAKEFCPDLKNEDSSYVVGENYREMLENKFKTIK